MAAHLSKLILNEYRASVCALLEIFTMLARIESHHPHCLRVRTSGVLQIPRRPTPVIPREAQPRLNRFRVLCKVITQQIDCDGGLTRKITGVDQQLHHRDVTTRPKFRWHLAARRDGALKFHVGYYHAGLKMGMFKSL